MKVYIAWYDNGEQYEDAFVSLKGIFATRELALEHIKEEGYTLRDGTKYSLPEPEVPDYCECGVPLDRFAECYECNDCDEECCFNDYVEWEYDNSFMYVEERELIER